MTKVVEAGSHHLWLTAQAIGVLDFQRSAVLLPDRTSGKQATKDRRHILLPTMTPNSVDSCVERRVVAAAGLDGKSASHQGCAQCVLDPEQRIESERGRDLGAIDQRHAFLWPEAHGRETGALQAFCGGKNFAVVAYLTDAHQRRRHVRQRCEIARCADRSLCRDARIDLLVGQGQQRLNHFPADAGIALRKRCRFHYQNQPHNLIAQGFAGAGAMRQDQVALEFGQLVVVDTDAGELAEAGIDRVDRPAGRNQMRDRCKAGIDRDAGFRDKTNRIFVSENVAPNPQRNGTRREHSFISRVYCRTHVFTFIRST